MDLHLDSLERVRLEQSLENARVVQTNLMPQIPRDFPGFDMFGWYQAAERTSGDFYDFFKTRDGRFGVVIGDVTGHGPGSALITSTAQASLRTSLRFVPDLCEAVTMVNQDLIDRMEDGIFITLFIAMLSKDGSIQLLNAGHTSPQVFHPGTGEVEHIDSHGPALGLMADYPYESSGSLQLEPGEVLLAFTDGITEARSLERPDDLLGESGLAELFRREAKSAADARELAEKLISGVVAFSEGNCEDDMTLVTVRRTGS